MKTLQKWVGAMMLIGMMAVSCTKPGSVYGGTHWVQEYQVETNDGYGGRQTITHVISLVFSDGGQECTIVQGYVDLDGFSSVSYDVTWAEDYSFTLTCQPHQNSFLYNPGEDGVYGEISGNTMTLTFRTGCIVSVYELEKIP